MNVEAQSGHRARLLVVAGFSPEPSGRWFPVSQDSLAAAMEAAGLKATVTVPDRLGADERRTFEVSFAKPTSFKLTEVVRAVAPLEALRALAEELGAADPAKRPAPDAVLERIGAVVGGGRLAARVADLYRPGASGAAGAGATPAPAPAGAPSAAGGGDAIDAIFAQAEVKAAPTAQKGVDAFVRAMREPAAGAAKQPPSTVARSARQAIEELITATAGDILRAPEIGRIEAAWRGLKLILDQIPSVTSLAVEALDVEPAAAPAALRELLEREPNERPDLVVLSEPQGDLAVLAALGSIGEDALSPVIASFAPECLGFPDLPAVAAEDALAKRQLPDAWNELRADDVSRWLTLVANRFVLATDGAGLARRVCFGTPAMGLAAMLAASYRDTGAFGRLFGNAGMLKAPSVWEIQSGRDVGTAIPTEVFLSMSAQSRLAALGIVGLGSGRNSDKIALSAAPTLKRSSDAVPLTAQVLTGQIVRLAQWVRAQLPPKAEDKDVVTLFEQAADVFLFPGMAGGAKLKAQVARNEAGAREVILAANARPEIAGIPFEFAFSLPLG